MHGCVTIGPSGYSYPEWRGVYYPRDLPPRLFLAHAARRFASIELNGTFYSLKSPAVFQRWAADVPRGFVFAIKGSRLVTHRRDLAGAARPLANFWASGVLALGPTTGPFLWQLPPWLAFDPSQIEAFLDLLPRSTAEAESLAGAHDLGPAGALTRAPAPRPLRHAIEVRHPSFVTPALYRILERRGCALVVADTAGRFPCVDERTADFAYVRLHGSTQLYVSRYTDGELDAWADRIERCASPPDGRDVYVYFDNTAEAHAPFDAERLVARMKTRGLARKAAS